MLAWQGKPKWWGADFTSLFPTRALLPGTCSYKIFLDGQAQPPDHACNWNRIRFGQSVFYSPFTEMRDGSTSNPVDLGLPTPFPHLSGPCTPDPATGAARLECPMGRGYELDEGERISID